MVEKRKLECYVLRYVPDVVKGEFVNIGVMMLEAEKGEFAGVKFTRDWRRVQCLDPQADIEMLGQVEASIRQQLTTVEGREKLIGQMEHSFSNLIQLSPLHSCMAVEPAKEIEVMASIYLESVKVAGERAESGRRKIVKRMQEVFEEAGVLDFMEPVAVESFTKPGDTFEFDLGYPLGDEMKLFHAVSMKANVDSAVLLAARYPVIAAKMLEKSQVHTRLTAVIDDDLDMGRENMQFALGMMQDEKIRVARMRELPAIAEEARRESKA